MHNYDFGENGFAEKDEKKRRGCTAD